MTWSAALSQEAIARQLGISADTLQKYFAVELATGREILMAECVAALRKQVAKGSIPAIRFQAQLAGKLDLPTDKDLDAATAVPAEPKKPKLGKKEEAQIAAETAGAGTEWANDLSPPPGTLVS